MVFKSIGSISRFQRKNQFWKICPKILPKKCTKSAFQTKPAKFDTFWPISQDSVHIFQNRFLRWNREFEPVDLNTMNPIIWTIFFSLIKGSEPFCRPFPHLKMAQSCLFESISWFSIYIYTTFLTIDRINFNFMCFSLRLIMHRHWNLWTANHLRTGGRKFVKKAANHPKYQNWFRMDSNLANDKDTKYIPVQYRTERYKDSPLPYLTELLNTLWWSQDHPFMMIIVNCGL